MIALSVWTHSLDQDLNGQRPSEVMPDLLAIQIQIQVVPERIYNPITAMGFSAMFTFQLDNTKG